MQYNCAETLIFLSFRLNYNLFYCRNSIVFDVSAEYIVLFFVKLPSDMECAYKFRRCYFWGGLMIPQGSGFFIPVPAELLSFAILFQ